MTSDSGLQRLVQSYLDLRWHIDPVDASTAGLSDHDARLGTFTAADVRQFLAALKSIAASIEEHHPDSLDDEIDRTALLGEVRVAIHELEVERPHVRNPEFWLSHALRGLHVLLAARDRSPAHKAHAAASRIKALPVFLDAASNTLTDCPGVFVETATQVARAGQMLIDEVATELVPADEPDFPNTVRVAKEALTAFVEDLPATSPQGGSTAFAVGEDAFHFRLNYQHALSATADELWRYGDVLIQEVEAELATLAGQIDPRTPWPDLIERLRGDHPPVDQLVVVYADAMRDARGFVEARGLAPIPEAPLDVVPTPAFLRPVIPFAAYQAPAVFSPDRGGWFYVTPPDGTDPGATDRALRDHCIHEIPATALHEGYPGHHLHLVTAQRHPSLVRRIIGTPLTVEGWALYCEEMMGEEGFYTTSEQRLFQRLALLWRAVRVMLDVGLHTRGMQFGEAVDLLIDKVHFDRSHAEAEVRRYCAEPVYQLCYAVGRRELRALRAAYRAAAGADYSLRGFHEAVLRFGALPVSLMRWGMRLDG